MLVHELVIGSGNRSPLGVFPAPNGTFVNRARIYPAQRVALNVNDVVQIGTVQLKVIV